MMLNYLAITLCLGCTLSAAQTTTTSACGVQGTAIGSVFGTYQDTSSIKYSTFSICNIYCSSTTACQSFGIEPSVECVLFSATVANNVVANSSSPWTFYPKNAVCPDIDTPTCDGFVGYDAGGNIGYSSDAVEATYGGCLGLCSLNSECLSFGITSTPACILYPYVVEGHDIASPGSGNTFWNAGGLCPDTTTTSTIPTTTSIVSITTLSLTTTTLAIVTPTCSGFEGYDASGVNIGYYTDTVSATYSGCLALCNANSECLSFGLTAAPACILYDYVVEGNDVSAPGSGNTFYDRGGCSSTTVSTSLFTAI